MHEEMSEEGEVGVIIPILCNTWRCIHKKVSPFNLWSNHTGVVFVISFHLECCVVDEVTAAVQVKWDAIVADGEKDPLHSV